MPRSAALPAGRLERAHVYGYNGLGTLNKAPNLCVTRRGQLVYCTAALAIVYDPTSGQQRYFDRTLQMPPPHL